VPPRSRRPSAQEPTLDAALARLHAYLDRYQTILSTVVAEERYSQTVVTRTSILQSTRVLRSDYAPARSPGGQAWTGFRDTYEVDGRPVRDREDRLARLLAEGSPASAEHALRITRENARFNIGDNVVTRTINVPTVALDMLHARNAPRFTFTWRGGDEVLGRHAWVVAYSERRSPTMLRTPQGKDRQATGTVWVDPLTGEVLRTVLSWQDAPSGRITVHYQDEPAIGALVPGRMSEEYQGRNGSVTGEATYTNYRRFQTAARIITPDSR
jgi:hypothetical protein